MANPTPDSWAYGGESTGAEFQEVIERNADGTILAQKMQKRKVLTYRRSRLCQVTENTTMPTSVVGSEDTAVNITSYLGAWNIIAGGPLSWGLKWVCTAHDFPVPDAGCPWYIESQTWESKDEWVDFDWPVV